MRRHDVLLSLAGMTCFLLTYPAPATPQPRMALIIGNAAYQQASLRTPVNDATDMATTLHQLGFDSTLLLDVDLRMMQAALQLFSQRLRQGGWDCSILQDMEYRSVAKCISFLLVCVLSRNKTSGMRGSQSGGYWGT